MNYITVDDYKLYNNIASLTEEEETRIEFFLDLTGKKISKSKGNGIGLDEWLRYTPPETLKHFMFGNPKTARTMDIQELARYVDAYLDDINTYDYTKPFNTTKLSPIYFIDKNTTIKYQFSFNLLVNLAKGLQPESFELFTDFLKNRYTFNKHDEELIAYAYRYFDEKCREQIEYTPPTWFIKYVKQLYNILSDSEIFSDKFLKDNLFSLGKQAIADGYVKNIHEWCVIWYNTILKSQQGPRLASLFMLYGKEYTLQTLKKVID
mgnify:CR=1 FL=1